MNGKTCPQWHIFSSSNFVSHHQAVDIHGNFGALLLRPHTNVDNHHPLGWDVFNETPSLMRIEQWNLFMKHDEDEWFEGCKHVVCHTVFIYVNFNEPSHLKLSNRLILINQFDWLLIEWLWAIVWLIESNVECNIVEMKQKSKNSYSFIVFGDNSLPIWIKMKSL